MIKAALVLGLLAFGTAWAEPFPATYQVRGVAENDVLNIRAEPSASSAIIGKIWAYEVSVEILRLSDNGRWGLVGQGDGNGWVAMRFLEQNAQDKPGLVPRPLVCLGTEPFWTIGLYPRGAEFRTPEVPRTDLLVTDEGVTTRGFFALAEEGPTRRYRLTATRESCGDGMSDREFGYSANLSIEGPDGSQTLTGCCTLDSRQ